MSGYTPEQIETLCEVMHDAYEQAALETGWETQVSSRKPWSSVPEANKATMRVAVQSMIESVAFSENLAKRDRDIAARAWEEGWDAGWQYALWMQGEHKTDNPYREETE